jgi:hypothetical protein
MGSRTSGPIDDFELDAKRVVDSFLSTNNDITEFGSIINNCRTLFGLYYENSSVEFVRIQANEVAHVLAKAATLLATPSVPNCMTFWAFHTY